ncbi:DUF2975 domain-containing protein [Paenibacillus sp. DXFW5]|uniref:DUF2975 domain-containing protein n=1 Tax=Paenibacillus rhizolycopersici TaxID=2780073 RepID=A0ABS2HF78_9BACL|nr:DUF2975 domain-containing protein [Paenibacillus rhizolycopersici]MBM6998198.1 DUF2975 domain-containing protein [Paenibacillus rhizolycopersici]
MKREQGSTLFLRGVVFLMGIAILAVCALGVPTIAKELVEYYPPYIYLTLLIPMYASAIPFFYALYQTLKLLSYIDKNTAFSEASVKALKSIRNCAIAICILYAVILPILFIIAEKDDAPGLAALGLVICFASLVIAVFAAVLQRLLRNAIDIKSENDLTI